MGLSKEDEELLKQNEAKLENYNNETELLNNIYTKPDKVIINFDDENEENDEDEPVNKSYSEKMRELLKDFPSNK